MTIKRTLDLSKIDMYQSHKKHIDWGYYWLWLVFEKQLMLWRKVFNDKNPFDM